MRLIDVDALKQEWGLGNKCEECPQNTRICQYEQDFTRMDICQMLDDAPTVGGWISVKDRFPEFPCITYDIHGNMDYCKTGIVKMCIDGTWYACTENMVHLEEVLHPNKNTAAMVMGNHIMHWMPLPEPQKEDEE